MLKASLACLGVGCSGVSPLGHRRAPCCFPLLVPLWQKPRLEEGPGATEHSQAGTELGPGSEALLPRGVGGSFPDSTSGQGKPCGFEGFILKQTIPESEGLIGLELSDQPVDR